MGWTAPNGIIAPRWSLSSTIWGKPSIGKSNRNFATVTRVGVDLEKKVFQVHAIDAKGEVVAARKLRLLASAGFHFGGPRFSSTKKRGDMKST